MTPSDDLARRVGASFAALSDAPSRRVLPTIFGPEPAGQPMIPAHPIPAVQPRENDPGKAMLTARPKRAQPKALPRITEKVLVQAIARWLEGEPWPHDDAAFRPYHGLNVRLRQRGDQLEQEGVAIVSRNPAALCKLPEGTRTTNRWEAHALCAVAVRGDAGMYR